MGALGDLLLDPFRPAYMQRALVEILILAIPSGILGSWVVMRRLAFLSHALGHVTFPALVVAYLAGWSIFGTALAASVVAAVALGVLAERRELADGVAVGVVLSASVALGAVLVSAIATPGVGAGTLLFGSLLSVDDGDIARSAVVAVASLAVGAGLGRQLMAATFDPAHARAAGLRLRTLDVLLLATLAAAVSVAVTIVGSLMLSGLVLVPAATARLLTSRRTTLQLAATVLAALDGVVGLWLAVRLDAPPGACVALVAVGGLVLVAAATEAVRYRARRSAWG